MHTRIHKRQLNKMRLKEKRRLEFGEYEGTKREERGLIRLSPRLESETLQWTFPAKLNTVPIFPLSFSVPSAID